RRSTLVTSQLPFEHWHAVVGDTTFADAILDRLIHSAHRFTLKGASMRRNASGNETTKRSRGYAAQRRFARRWPESIGISGRFEPEQAAGFRRIGWPESPDYAGCAVGATCPAVIAAYATLTGAALALSAAQMVLEDCLSSSSGGGGDPGGDLPNCTTYIIEVSYDNGVTWEYLDTVTVCE